MRRSHAFSRGRQRGFTLIELLITLVIVSVGMLGLAKLQAAAVAESGVSRTRSLMTFQAESLAGMMQSNRSYWGATTGTPPKITMTAAQSSFTDVAGTMASGTPDCVNKVCTAARIAAADVQTWASAFDQNFPTGAASVVCALNASKPTTCDITLTWSEHYVAINNSATTGTKSAGDTVSMVLHVQP